MSSEIENQIKLIGNNVDEYNSIYKKILSLDVQYGEKTKLLTFLKDQSWSNGIDLSNLIIPKPKNEKTNRVLQAEPGSIEVVIEDVIPVVDVIVDDAEYTFISNQLSIIQKNFPFLQPVVLKNGVQIQGFKTAIICCDEISTDYLNTYFTGQRYISCLSFCTESFDLGLSYIFLLLWPHNKKRNTEVLKKIKDLKEVEYFDPIAFARKDSYWRKNQNYLNDHIDDYLNLKYDLPLVNIDLTIDQERLVRKAVGSPTGFLTYRVLTGGYTGALVLEVTSVGNGNARKKFVLKIAKKDKKWETIAEEFKNFQDYVENLSLKDGKVLTAQRFEMGDWEAIKYPFASLNSVSNSESFRFFLKEAKSKDEIKSIISKIFKSSLILNWSGTFSHKPVELFHAFEKLDWCIRDFQRIKDFQTKFNYSSIFDFKKLSEIFEKKEDLIFCTAHGDLHVENIRVDIAEQEVFFIDFGRTGSYPMGIDYVALECSIRFKILDAAFPHADLGLIDDMYFSNFSEILSDKDDQLSRIQYVISLIRQSYIDNFPANHRAMAERQYQLCFFAVASWLLNKDNLNRPYIWATLERIYKNTLISEK